MGNLAGAQYWSGERESARASYEHAIDLAESYLGEGSDNQSVMADLAEYYGMVGQHDRGIELLEAVIRKEIHDPYSMGAIAESYEILGELGRGQCGADVRPGAGGLVAAGRGHGHGDR